LLSEPGAWYDLLPIGVRADSLVQRETLAGIGWSSAGFVDLAPMEHGDSFLTRNN
jgi:phosphopentomutase